MSETAPQETEFATRSEASVELADTAVQDVVARQRSRERSQHKMEPPATIPGYTILRCLGQGAYGSVWLGYEQKTGKQVAIKFYLHRRGLDWTLLNREIEKLAVLYTSRSIVRLIDVGWGSDPPYFVMEYLENGSLQALLDERPLAPREAVRIVRSILRGLVHAHGCGILHCDLKPANILLDGEFEPRLCDFGQSRLSDQQDPALGTLFYMAPEQADLRAVPDARWDVYALGALFYHLLCGHPPHRDPANESRIQSTQELGERLAAYRRIVRESPAPKEHRRQKGVDKRLAEIVDRCLAVDPEQRFPNAQAVLDALELRERQKARRPLIALGVIGPALLLVSMIPIALSAMSNAVKTAQANQIERALESDGLSVKILARGIEGQLERRKAELVDISKDPELRTAIESSAASAWKDRTSLHVILNHWYQKTDTARRRQGQTSEPSWFLCDAEGFQRWRSQISPVTIDRNWAHRDYFNGRNQNYPPDQVPDDIGPLRKPHISLAYRGTSEEKYKVAISTPVWDQNDSQVIAVLARTSELGELLSEYEDKIHGHARSEVQRIIALADHRDGKILYHPWIRAAHLRDAPDKVGDFERLRLSATLLEQLSDLDSADQDPNVYLPTTHYRDPVARIDPQNYGDDWLAAICPVLNTSWLAIVQESQTAAVQPVEKLQVDLNRAFLLGVTIFFVLMGTVWFFVARALMDRDIRLWPRDANGERLRSLTTTAE